MSHWVTEYQSVKRVYCIWCELNNVLLQDTNVFDSELGTL